MFRSVRAAMGVIFAILAIACTSHRSTLEPSLSAAIRDEAARIFAHGQLWSPADGDSMAPLFIVEQDAAGEADDTTTMQLWLATQPFEHDGRTFTGREYRWNLSNGGGGTLRGLFGEDGFPLLYEVPGEGGGMRRVFVSSELEAEAAAEFGEILDGRRFAIERSTDEAERTVVAAEFESGSMPLGPFVYLDARGDVTTVICRCMPSQVESIEGAGSYSVESVELSGFSLKSYAEELRLPLTLSRLPHHQ